MLALPELLQITFLWSLPTVSSLSPAAFEKHLSSWKSLWVFFKTNHMWKAPFGGFIPLGNSSPFEKYVHTILLPLSGRALLFSVVSLKWLSWFFCFNPTFLKAGHLGNRK